MIRRERMRRQWHAVLAAVALVGISAATGASPVAAEPPVANDASAVRPVIVLLDTSGSMNDDDGSGTIKLTGAKSAIGDIVRGLSASTVFGVWSYPLGGSCNPGRYVSAPAPLTDRTSVIQSVDQLIAIGDTPTGVALRSLADALKPDYAGATIVVISDGETTCGPAPCDIAEDIVDEGFDVKVPTVAFNTSKEGEDELRCIAAATGAESFTADDSDALAATLDDLLSPRLSVDVDYDTTPASGSSTRITATVEQSGGSDAENVQLSLGFIGPETQRLPAAIPPIVALGNLPAGHSRTYSWVIATGPPGTSTDAAFRVAAWAGNAKRATAEGLYTTTAQADGDFGPVLDGVDAQHPIAIFGDSYSAGEGGGNYAAGNGYVEQACHRSPNTYLTSSFAGSTVANFACSGAVTSAVRGTSRNAHFSQIDEFEASMVTPGAAVTTFGGNDAGFADIVTFCALNDCTRWRVPEMVDITIDNLRTQLRDTYIDLWSLVNSPSLQAKRDGDYAPLLVLGYPRVTRDPRYGACNIFSAPEVSFVESLANRLNGVIRAAVSDAQAKGYEVYFVDTTQDALRPDHTLCSSEPWINQIAIRDRAEWVHPNPKGYEAMTARIAQWSRSVKPFAPSVSDATIRNTIATFPVASGLAIGTVPTQTIEVRDSEPTDPVVPDSFLRLQGGDYLPGSPVTVTVHSEPVVLGTLVVDENGEIDTELLLPDDIPLGAHDLVVEGIAADGSAKTVTIPLAVVAPTPLWVVVVAIGAATPAVVAIASGIAAWWARRRRPDDPGPVETSSVSG